MSILTITYCAHDDLHSRDQAQRGEEQGRSAHERTNKRDGFGGVAGIVDRGQLCAAADEAGQAEGDEKEPAGRLEEAVSTTNEDTGDKGGGIVYHFPDGNAVGIRYFSHSEGSEIEDVTESIGRTTADWEERVARS